VYTFAQQQNCVRKKQKSDPASAEEAEVRAEEAEVRAVAEARRRQALEL
jgi:hypothetical protein